VLAGGWIVLSKEDNELLCRVGPGTPMGDLMRQYWIPALTSFELPAADGPPMRVRLLGEDLVAFRDSTGSVGLLGANCAHRGASLFFGRNEECGLRCVYHGWKYDIAGHCIDMPNEPPESNFREKVRQKAYPCRERAGIIWTYMGPLAAPPDLPELEFTLVPDEQRYLSKRLQPTNFAQALEGEIDQSHVSFLHSSLKVEDDGTPQARVAGIRSKDRHPHFEAVDSDIGVQIGARRAADDGMYYWRITQFLMPFFTLTGPYGENPTRSTRAWIPIDDENTMVYVVTYHPLRPITEQEIERMRKGTGLHVGVDRFELRTTDPLGAWRTKANASNDYCIDYELQRTTKFSGIPEFWAQDAACQESMGTIYDRTQEHLGTSDLGVIRVRQRWIDSAKALRDRGEASPGASDPRMYRVRAAALLLPEGASWVNDTREHTVVIPGVNPSAV
jgi:phthalate 4,5-dioxygenase oxygenase subunit